MNVSDLIDPSFSYRLIITLLHFLWQGCLVALLAMLGDGLLSRVSASRRYALHVAALAIMVACVAVTFSRIVSPASAPEVSAESTALAADTELAALGREDVDPSLTRSTATSGFVGGEPSFPTLLPVADAVDAVAQPSVRPEQFASDDDLWRPLQQWAPRITLLYFACCGFLLARLVRGTWLAQRLRRMATAVTDERLLAAFQRQSKVLGLRVLPRIAWCAQVSIPLVIGVFKPMILLPTAAATGLTPDQLQALITHELAHIRRYDLLVNLVQRVVESMLFFHPAVWFISRHISNEREQACDELVLATGCERLRYADALVRMAELSSSLRNLGTSAPASALAASGANSSEFKRRVLKVLSVPTTSHLRPSRIALLAIVTVIVGMTASASRLRLDVFADHQPSTAEDSLRAGRGAPDPALGLTADLLDSEDEKNKATEAKGNDKQEPLAAGSIVEVFQEFTPDNLPVPDVSHIRDPDQLLDQLEKGPRVSHFLMTGGGIFWQAEMAPETWQIDLWNRTFAGDKGLDPRVRQLIKLGDAARAKVQQRLVVVKPPDKSHLALVLRSTGTVESIPVLIKALHVLNNSNQATVSSSWMSTLAVTSALWELTGRKHHYTAKEWEQWWKGVGPDFVVPRDRQRPEISVLVTKQRVQVLVAELAKQEVVARERLIALGPAAVPHLLESLQDELKREPAEVATQPGAARTMAHRLAWVVDELGATKQLPGLLRRNYFAQRFADGGTYAGRFPIDEDALCRAISHCSFAEYCSIVLEAESQEIDQPPGKWPVEFYDAYGRRFEKRPPHVIGDMSQRPIWNKVVPAADPVAEITDAVPVLLAALKDERLGMRKGATKLAAAIGFCSDVKPETLIIALRDAWLAETVDNVRPEFAFAMCRFATSFVVKEISNGLFSDRPEIVSDCAGLMDWLPIQLNDETRPTFKRLVELTHHENNKLRQRAVASLRGKAVTLLTPELLRLSQDSVSDIRKECAFALRDKPDPKFADILFQLASDPNEQVRIEAINSIANLNHPESMPRLVPLLGDKQVYGYAVAALASMGGKDALPLMMNELKTGNDVGGMIYQHLKLLTGEKFDNKPEPWLGWWKQQSAAVRKILGPTIVLPDHLNVMAVGFARDSQDLVTVATETDVAVRVWDLAEKKLRREVKFETDQHGNLFLQSPLILSGDRQRVVAMLDGKLTIWDSATGKLFKTLTVPKELENGFLRGLACTPDLSVIACGRTPGFGGLAGPDAHAIVWDVAAGRVLRTVTHANAVQIQSVALSSDGKFLATGGQAAGMCVWDVSTGKLLHQLPNDNPGRKHPDPEVPESGANQVLCVRFSPDGQQIAIGDMLGVKLVDVKTGKLLIQCDAPFRFGRSGLVFSKDGQLLARTATDKVVPIWSTQTGKLFAELPTEAHDGSFSDDGRSFAVGFTDAKKGLAVWQLSGDAGKAEEAEGPGPDSPVDKPANAVATKAIYHPEPEHLWNRMHEAFFVRRGPDAREYGRDRLEPLLWSDSKHLLEPQSHQKAMGALTEFLTNHGERLINEPLQRAMMQRDLWLVFNWVEGAPHARFAGPRLDETEAKEAVRRLRAALVTAIRRLELEPKAIQKLPDNYAAAVSSGQFAKSFDPQQRERPFLPPDLFDPNGPWACIGRLDGRTAPQHLREENPFTNSVFSVFVRLPNGRAGIADYLKQLPSFPPGTQLALVRRAMLIDSEHQVVASNVIENVQLRVIGATRADESFFEFRLSRPNLLSAKAGGLIAATKSDRDLKTGFLVHPFDPMESTDEAAGRPFPGANVRPLLSCTTCHEPKRAEFQSARGLSATPENFPLAEMSPSEITKRTISWKTATPVWLALQQFLAAPDIN